GTASYLSSRRVRAGPLSGSQLGTLSVEGRRSYVQSWPQPERRPARMSIRRLRELVRVGRELGWSVEGVEVEAQPDGVRVSAAGAAVRVRSDSGGHSQSECVGRAELRGRDGAERYGDLERAGRVPGYVRYAMGFAR